MKIRTKIFLTYVGAGYVLVVIGAIIIYAIMSRFVVQNTYNILHGLANARLSALRTYYVEQIQQGIFLAELNSLEEILYTFNQKLEQDPGQFERMIDTIDLISSMNREVTLSGVVDPKGNEVIGDLGHHRNRLFIEPDAFTEITSGVFLSELHQDTQGVFSQDLYVAVEADTPNTRTEGELLGYLVLSFTMEEVHMILSDQEGLGDSGELYLIDQEGYLLTPSRFIDEFPFGIFEKRVSAAVVSACADDSFHTEKLTDYRGVAVYHTHVRFPELGWCLIAELDEREGNRPLQTLLTIAFWSILLIVFVDALIGVVVSQWFAHPLDALKNKINEIISGDLSARVQISTGDELEDIGSAFNLMTDKLQEAIESTEAEVKRRTQELEKMNSVMIGREVRMAEMKRELKELNAELENLKKQKKSTDV